jgi:hypothetical protein
MRFCEHNSSRWAAHGNVQFVTVIGMDTGRVRGIGGCQDFPNGGVFKRPWPQRRLGRSLALPLAHTPPTGGLPDFKLGPYPGAPEFAGFSDFDDWGVPAT